MPGGRSGLQQALERVRGSVEIGVRARLPEPAAPPMATARTATVPRGCSALLDTRAPGYLRRRLERRQEANGVRQQLAPLEAVARGSLTQSGLPSSDLLLRSYLVERARVPEFMAAVRALDDQCPELELVCTGPSPPHSFIGAWR